VLVHRVPAEGRPIPMLTEARRAIEVDHPCVVRVRSADAAGAEVLVATDYVDGEIYPALLVAAREQRRPITLKLTLRVVCDVLAGLSAMHGGTGGLRHDRMIFGRLSPEDVLVGADGLTRVILGARQSRTASGIGYLAPEIALGSDAEADERSDVYAVGVILWEALAQQRLYDEKTLDGLVAAQLRGGIPVPPLPDDAPWADPVLDVTMRAVAPDPGDRYVSAGAMLEALLEAAGRRVGTAGDVVELVESLVGPFIRARRREASMPATASNSDIRATTPDTEDETLRPVQSGEIEMPTAVDVKNPLLLERGAISRMPHLNDDEDPDELKTEIQPDLLRALPAADAKPIMGTRRPSFAEDPSVTSTLPPEMKRDLIAKQRQLGEDAPTITKSVAAASGALASLGLDDDAEAHTAIDESISVNVTGAGALAMRSPSDSVVTLDLPPDREASIATARRPAPTMQSRLAPPRPSTAANEEVEELLAKTASLDRSAFPAGPPLILEETVNMEQAAEMRRAVAALDATLDLRRAQPQPEAPGFGPRTVPLAMPVPGPGALAPTMPMAMATSPTPPPVAVSPHAPYVTPPHLHPPHPLPSQPSPSQPSPSYPSPSHPSQPSSPSPSHPMFPPQASPPRTTITEEQPQSSALLGVFTFFLVLASLLVVAWLTYPYWRAWAGL
jgi:eukaryotic-like serine/threonine-protein kinase